MKKLTVYLKGGLGNQMFQYAYAKAKQNSGVNIAINDYQLHHTPTGLTRRELAITHFNISFDKFESDTRKRDWWLTINNRLGKDLSVRYSNYFANKKNGVADGYFNTEKYFPGKEMRDTLLKEFTLREESGSYKKWKEKITSSHNPCIIHARRGDYLKQGSNPGLNILTEEYYQKALTILPKDISIFIFSDEPEWLQNALEDRNVTVVSGNGLADYEELSLMRYGKYYIIPNSTFAWWGAWLSETTDKIIIAPKKWFNWTSWRRANEDIVPETWIRI